MPQWSMLSLVAILGAAVAAFAFGAVWYSALGKPWMKAARIDPADANMSPALFATTFVILLVISTGLYVILAASATDGSIGTALIVAVSTWFVFTAGPMAVNHRYQGFRWDLTVIDALHWLGVFSIMSVVISVIA
ncbi:MAG: DUF1761 domain-containing protein [Pseudomonadota bacterium]